jgi:CRISPR-associated endoribonuclease Cas6
MAGNTLYSLILELTATTTVTIPALRGDHTHALFFDLVRQVDPVLSSRLHDVPEYRPFTVSRLRDVITRNGEQTRQTGRVDEARHLIGPYHDLRQLHAGQIYQLRITLLDGGEVWQRLSTHVLESERMSLRLDKAAFQLTRVLSTTGADHTGWTGHTDWQTLAQGATAIQAAERQLLTLHFASPCAFSLGNRRFALFPEPMLVWDSLMRTWNRYAPEVLRIEKTALRAFVNEHVTIHDHNLFTGKVAFIHHGQKGFQGACTYRVPTGSAEAAQLLCLAEFARYAGIGYKTTMGMGQARLIARSGVHAAS